MKDMLVFDEDELELNIATDNYLIACIDNVGEIVVNCDCLSDESLANLYLALFNEMNSRLSVEKFLSYLKLEDIVKLFGY